MKQQNRTLRQLVLSAMFAALCWAATMLVQIPTVAGYTNIGEGMCLLSGLVLGPWYGFFAAAADKRQRMDNYGRLRMRCRRCRRMHSDRA